MLLTVNLGAPMTFDPRIERRQSDSVKSVPEDFVSLN